MIGITFVGQSRFINLQNRSYLWNCHETIFPLSCNIGDYLPGQIVVQCGVYSVLGSSSSDAVLVDGAIFRVWAHSYDRHGARMPVRLNRKLLHDEADSQ